MTHTDIAIESVTEYAGRTLRAWRGTVNLSVVVSHYNFSVTFLILEWETWYFIAQSMDAMILLTIKLKCSYIIAPFPSWQHRVHALFLCAFAAKARWGLMSLADKPEAVLDSKLIQDAPPTIPSVSEHGGGGGGYAALLTHVHSARLTHITQQYVCCCAY